MPDWVERGVDEYQKRLPAAWRFRIQALPQAGRGDGSVESARRTEAMALSKACPDDAYRVALDERGRTLSTADLAQRLERWADLSRPITILIGGPDGLHEDALSDANESLSLSRLTFPHPLVRVILVEQLYRAHSLSVGHPYHRA